MLHTKSKLPYHREQWYLSPVFLTGQAASSSRPGVWPLMGGGQRPPALTPGCPHPTQAACGRQWSTCRSWPALVPLSRPCTLTACCTPPKHVQGYRSLHDGGPVDGSLVCNCSALLQSNEAWAPSQSPCPRPEGHQDAGKRAPFMR